MALQGKAKREILRKIDLCPDFGILSFLENKLMGEMKHAVGLDNRHPPG